MILEGIMSFWFCVIPIAYYLKERRQRETALSIVKSFKQFWTRPRTIRIIVLIGVSAILAVIQIPCPIGRFSLYAIPCYLAGFVKKWDWKEAFIVGWVAVIIVSLVTGYIWIFGLILGVFLGISAGIITRFFMVKWNAFAAVIVGVPYGSIVAVYTHFLGLWWLITGNFNFALGVANLVFPAVLLETVLGVSVAAIIYVWFSEKLEVI